MPNTRAHAHHPHGGAPSDRDGRTCFVTGFPGFIARFLIREVLVQEPDSRVFALVQPRFIADAEKWSETLPPEKRARLQLVSGDILDMHLGLSSDEYTRLTATVTDVFHLAAVNSLRVPRDMMNRVNVDGTRNVLELAADCPHLTRFNFFSSAFVSGSRVGVITEDEFDEGQKFRNPFEETKFAAERVVRRARDRVPTTIYRPSYVVGDSVTGEVDRFGGPYYLGILIGAMPKNLPMPLPGEGAAPLNMVPVDYVVRATVALSKDPTAVGKTFHITDPNPLSVRRVYELIAQQSGRTVPKMRIPAFVATTLMRAPGLRSRLKSPLAVVESLDHLAIYNCTHTLRHLEGTGVLCPPFESYVGSLVQFAQAHFTRRAADSGEVFDPLAESNRGDLTAEPTTLHSSDRSL